MNIYEHMKQIIEEEDFYNLLAAYNSDDISDPILKEKFANAKAAYWELVDYLDRKSDS